MDRTPIPKPAQEGFHFEDQQEGITRDWVSRPINPWQESNLILERQQEGGFFPLQFSQISPRDIALGGIVLSLLGTVAIGQMHPCLTKSSCQKGNENDPKKTAENGISQQPINENGIRFLRVKRFWNPPTCEERKTVLRHVFPCFSVSTNRD